jgi:hypothetical protein
MKKKTTLQQFEAAKLSTKKTQKIKGGFRTIPGLPGGNGSIGLIDWGEIEIRHHYQVQRTDLRELVNHHQTNL